MMSDMQEAPAEAEPTNQGYTIEISVLPDGTFSVSSESIETEAVEETGEPGSEVGQQAKSFGEALKIALDIYKADGNLGNAQADFMAGFTEKREPTRKGAM